MHGVQGVLPSLRRSSHSGDGAPHLGMRPLHRPYSNQGSTFMPRRWAALVR